MFQDIPIGCIHLLCWTGKQGGQERQGGQGTAGQFGVPLGYIKRCSPMYEIFM